LNDQELKDYLKSVQIGLLGKLYVPFKKPQDISEINLFEGFGIVNPTDFFNRGWKFRVQDGSDSQNLQAFCAGTIVYETRGNTNRIILRNADVLGNLVRNDSLPDWFPLPNYIIYENVHERETKNVMRNYLRNHQKIVRAIQEQRQASVSIDEIVDLFASNSLPYGIPVQAGDLIGVMGEETPGTSGLRTLSLFMQHELDNYQGLFLDPAIYHKHWESFFPKENLAEYPLEMQVKIKKIFAGPIANGVIRYVKSGGGTTGDFLDPAFPAGLVSIALTAATPFDTIVIIDNAIYNEPKEITIDKAINITSLSTGDIIDSTPVSPFPTLDGNNSHRIFVIGKINDIVSISNISITRGLISPNTGIGGTKPYGGGGILIAYNDKTYIRNCHVHNNFAFREPKAVEEDGFGGGILVYHSSALIYRNRINENSGHKCGGGIGVFGYGWPVIQKNYILQNLSLDGAGIAIEIAFPSKIDITDAADLEDAWEPVLLDKAKKMWTRVIENEIDSNRADDDGGGVYQTALSMTQFSDNNIHDNMSKHAGGGIRATLASDLTLERDRIHHNTANTEHKSGNGGGGIAIRNCSVVLKDVRIEDNIVEGWAGGGIFYASNSEGVHPVIWFIEISYDEILKEIFRKTNNIMKITGTSDIVRNHCQMISSLGDRRKGGGIYALRLYDPLENFIGLPTTIFFNDINRILSNVLDPPPPPGFPNSAQIHIEDMYRPGEQPPIDDSNNSEFLTPKFGRMEFLYEPFR
jgi:hypothetical protein